MMKKLDKMRPNLERENIAFFKTIKPACHALPSLRSTNGTILCFPLNIQMIVFLILTVCLNTNQSIWWTHIHFWRNAVQPLIWSLPSSVRRCEQMVQVCWGVYTRARVFVPKQTAEGQCHVGVLVFENTHRAIIDPGCTFREHFKLLTCHIKPGRCLSLPRSECHGAYKSK